MVHAFCPPEKLQRGGVELPDTRRSHGEFSSVCASTMRELGFQRVCMNSQLVPGTACGSAAPCSEAPLSHSTCGSNLRLYRSGLGQKPARSICSWAPPVVKLRNQVIHMHKQHARAPGTHNSHEYSTPLVIRDMRIIPHTSSYVYKRSTHVHKQANGFSLQTWRPPVEEKNATLALEDDSCHEHTRNLFMRVCDAKLYRRTSKHAARSSPTARRNGRKKRNSEDEFLHFGFQCARSC